MTEFKILSDSELEVNLKKTPENVTNQISRHILNKKHKINYQYLIIDKRFNDNCLAEIFMYIPIYERPKIALVCKQWYRALHHTWRKVKTVKFSHWKYRSYQNIFDRFKKINGLSFLKSLLDNCGLYLTELDLVGYDNSDIVPFVNKSCPNVVKLRLRFKFIENEELSNAFSRMPKLKILKMIFQNTLGIPMTVLDSLKDVADTLSELTLAYWNGSYRSQYILPESFTVIISQLKNLQKIEITGICLTRSSFELIKNAKIDRFIEDYSSNIYLAQIIDFEDLRILSLLDYEITDDVLYTFANSMPRLYLMNIVSTYVTDVGIQTITRMRSLRYLYLHGSNQHITDSSIKLLKNLEKLRLPYSNKITNSSVIEVLKRSPWMMWLSIINTGVTPKFFKKASKITKKRENYLVLCVNFDENISSSRKYQLPYLGIHHHDTNIELNINFNGCCSQQLDLAYE
ncbi:uncharacterized protein LOC122851009 [Aphidius gifuensis]|uniref:uncharacterized protein LOC122851009 n=1 Tax=Aphidius gifuensis TaxID=684658 RepID=UPI001CDCC974|nr:uncharacterized protein LOC122851009 [Aphidius gifuensis]